MLFRSRPTSYSSPTVPKFKLYTSIFLLPFQNNLYALSESDAHIRLMAQANKKSKPDKFEIDEVYKESDRVIFEEDNTLLSKIKL